MYGESKRRSMLRSILPSTSRRTARENKRNAHKVERAKVRQALHPIIDCESAEDCENDLLVTSNGLIRDAMWERRGADKINHFVHWAEAITADIEDPHKKYDFMVALVPDNLVGRHALTHLPYAWRPGQRFFRYYRPLPKRTQQSYEHEYLTLYAALYECCVRPGMHRRLNDMLKRSFTFSYATRAKDERGFVIYERCACGLCANGARTLGGIGDIEAFIVDYHAGPGYRRYRHGETWKAMMAFLEQENLL